MPSTEPQLDQMLRYITSLWHVLRRGPRQLLQTVNDPKFDLVQRQWPLYISSQENIDAVQERLKQQLAPGDVETIDLRRLPADMTELSEHGLLYLPHEYVVPGGRFNEQYGWDSYFIVLGLVRSGEIGLAKNMVDNALYEIIHYGTLLNANRTYYLTRSQPPLLTGMLLAVFHHTKDLQWLRAAVPVIEQYYQYWLKGPHHVATTGLARYYDSGTGPAPEVLADERDDEGLSHYDRIQAVFRAHPIAHYGYDLAQFYDATRDRLTSRFYIADRSMRESGFDPSDRFGRFNLGILSTNPVCLNSLLYVMEQETATIYSVLGERRSAALWEERAARRAIAINRLMWDEQAGLYFDYDFEHGLRYFYPFISTFYPLWAGIASEAQAKRVIDNLSLFEASGGLQTSPNVSGSQWDAPFGWAPLHLIVVKALRRYGAVRAANRIANNFLSLVLEQFIQHNTIFEKYDVVNQTSHTHQQFGYSYNVVGFGWTNATVLELLAELPNQGLTRITPGLSKAGM